MLTKTHDIVLKLIETDHIDTGVKIVQNDALSHFLNIKVSDGFNEINYADVESAIIVFAKQDGNVVQGNLTKMDDRFTYSMGTNEIACPGVVLACVQLMGTSGQRLTTSRFKFTVIDDLLDPSAVESSTEFAALQQAMEILDTLEQKLIEFPNIKILGTFETVTELESTYPDGSELDGGFFVLENGEFYIWSLVTNEWESLGKIRGPQGEKGDTGDQGIQGPTGAVPDLQIGTVTTLQPGNPATVTRQPGSPDEAPIFNFGIPKGIDGAGAGDMTKDVYDPDDTGVVIDSRKLGGQLPAYYAKQADLESHLSDMPIDIKSYGAKGDGTSHPLSEIFESLEMAQLAYPHATALTNEIDWVIAQQAVNQATTQKRNVYIPAGEYTFDNTLIVDRSGTANRVSIIGAGTGNSKIKYTGNDKCIYFKGNPNAENDNYLSLQTISGVTLSCNLIPGSKALFFDTLALFKAEDINIGGFDYGMNMDGVEHSVFSKMSFRWNNRGIYATSTDFVAKTCPNNLTFINCHIGSNFVYGALFEYMTTVNFIGGSIENNGSNAGTTGNANNWGIKFKNGGYQGGVACNLVGVYIESNAGVADVLLENTAWEDLVDNSTIYSIIGCTFNRGTNDHYTVNNIRCTFAQESQAEKQKLSVINCSFKYFNTYVPDQWRKNILYDGIPINSTNFEQLGNIFASVLEAPEIPRLIKMGSLTRDMSATNGTVSYTNIGFKPKSIQVIFSSSSCDGSGMSDGESSGCIYYFGSTRDTFPALASFVNDGANFVRVILVSFDNDGFTLSFEKVGAPTGTGTIKYIAQG